MSFLILIVEVVKKHERNPDGYKQKNDKRQNRNPSFIKARSKHSGEQPLFNLKISSDIV